MHFFHTGREFLLTSAVYDVGLRAETERCSGRVHRHVPAADDHCLFGLHDRCPGIRAERFHQIASCQIFVGREDAHRLLARDMHELGQTCAGADEDGVKTFFLHQGVDRCGFADDAVCLYFDTEGLDVLHFLLDDRFLGQTELRNAVDQDSARLVQCFEDRDVITFAGEISRAGKAGGAGTNNCDFLSLGGCVRGRLDAHRSGRIRDVALQFADGDRFSLDPAHADAFALRLLRADASADSGKRR